MAFRSARPLRFRLTRLLRAGGAEDAKPRWTLPEADYHKYTYQPSIPDKHFNIGHWNYAPITMWLRARRPAMEKVLGDVYTTLTSTGSALWSPIYGNIHANLPGFGYKFLGLVGALIGYNLAVMYVTSRTEAWMFLEKMRLYALGDELVKKGFFMSDAEEAHSRQHKYDHEVERLNHLWEEAISDATQARSFDRLCEHLAVDAEKLPVTEIPKPISWRFSLMPYGRDDPDAKTFSFAPVDSPAASNYFLLDMGNSGDYIDRQDNKPNPIRKGRHMYTAAYMPPTKCLHGSSPSRTARLRLDAPRRNLQRPSTPVGFFCLLTRPWWLTILTRQGGDQRHPSATVSFAAKWEPACDCVTGGFGRPWGAAELAELGESPCSPVDRALGGSREVDAAGGGAGHVALPAALGARARPLRGLGTRFGALDVLASTPRGLAASRKWALAFLTEAREAILRAASPLRPTGAGPGPPSPRRPLPLRTARRPLRGPARGALAGNKISQARAELHARSGGSIASFALSSAYPLSVPGCRRAPRAMALNVITESRLFASEPDPRWFGNPRNPADTTAEGWTNQNWLKSRFHFSFAEYHEGPSNFGVLRVMNDDLVQGERGFGEHPHRDMEIMTFIVDGELTHKDSKGNEETLGRGAIQFMTAGTGIYHSEHNLAKKPLRFIQCWVVPRKRGLKPNYGSSLGGPEAAADRRDKWAHMVSDEMSSVATQIKIHQDCNVFCTELSPGKTSPLLSIAAGRQAYMLCVEGELRCGKQSLQRHDAAEVKGPLELELSAGPLGALVLLFEMAETRDSRKGF
ncbi:unnamed protein product [Symbiodinium microadriaticum]|nr:unnamed protein product [Symbiodinium microadriaticum]